MNNIENDDPNTSDPEDMDTMDDADQNKGGGEEFILNNKRDEPNAEGDDQMQAVNHLDDQQQEEDEDDEARAEATFHYVVPNISKLRETTLSPPVMVRSLPWKVMAMPRQQMAQDGNKSRNLGFFLQCNGEAEYTSWSCHAAAELRLLPAKADQEPFRRKISHLFYSKENDWGFSHFITFSDLLDPDKGWYNSKDDTITLEVHVRADAPHGVSWDSKKHTGYVGLKNQGATCYMNSLLQALFFTNRLREAVYLMPTEYDDAAKSVALALQRVFHELQFTDKPVGTKKLTKSFGWETLDSFMQHDVQELCRVLLDNIETKMKGTCVEGVIPKLFEGKTISYIKCKHVDYKSERTEAFYDIQLNVKGKKNIIDSFKDYIQPESLEGDNKYDAGSNGLQEAEKGVLFTSFPPVLHLQLMRFQYDPMTDTNIKINDKFEFYEKINLDPYLNKPEDTPATYILHAVLVHSGDNHGGHYVVYINPKGDGKWCKFDDDVVSRCTKQEAIENNFGGHDDEITVRHCTNAYMLVYIRESTIEYCLCDVHEESIPQSLKERLEDERRVDVLRRKERTDAPLYMQLMVILEDAFIGHQGFDLLDFDKRDYKDIARTFRVKKHALLSEVMQEVAGQMGYKLSDVRPWYLSFKPQTNSIRASAFEVIDRNSHQLNQPPKSMPLSHEEAYSFKLEELADHDTPMMIWLEVQDPLIDNKTLQPFDKNRDVLLFFKYYDPYTKLISYCGHLTVPIVMQFRELYKHMWSKAGLEPGTELLLFEEVKRGIVEELRPGSHQLDRVIDDLQDGDIILYQKKLTSTEEEKLDLPTAQDYYREVFQRVEVLFCDKTDPQDLGFFLELNENMNYEQVAQAVANRLGVRDPQLFQFFRSQTNYRDGPGTPLRCTYEGTLRDLMQQYKPKQCKRLYYQKLSIKVKTLEHCKTLKCVWVGSKMREEKELTLYPKKNSTVAALLEEAKKEVELEKGGTGKLRLLEIVSFKIGCVLDEDLEIEKLPTQPGKSYRIEEIPEDQLNLADNEMLIPVAHFSKEVFTTFGIPFLVKIFDTIPFKDLKAKIQAMLDLSEKEFTTYKFAVVSLGRAQFFEDQEHYPNFQIPLSLFSGEPGRAWIGLDHANKQPKRTNRWIPEKPIKIHN